MKFIQSHKDQWHTLGGEDGPAVCINPVPHLLLDVPQWHAFRAQWPTGMPVGVILDNDTDVEDIAADLPRLGLVALRFPKWVDGRAYSQAHLLRSRYRFMGEVRATGEVLVDMLPLLQRSGFTAVQMRADQSLEAAQRALTYFPAFYQGDVRDPLPLFAKPPGTAEALARAPVHEFVNDGASI
jgi:uncharacterized protein (DUF934 family)